MVGHYIGNAARTIPNATNEMLNANNFNPRQNAGKDGLPVVIEPKDLLQMQQLFQINRFNLLASDRIPLNRTLPDVRRKKYLLYLFITTKTVAFNPPHFQVQVHVRRPRQLSEKQRHHRLPQRSLVDALENSLERHHHIS